MFTILAYSIALEITIVFLYSGRQVTVLKDWADDPQMFYLNELDVSGRIKMVEFGPFITPQEIAKFDWTNVEALVVTRELSDDFKEWLKLKFPELHVTQKKWLT